LCEHCSLPACSTRDGHSNLGRGLLSDAEWRFDLLPLSAGRYALRKSVKFQNPFDKITKLT
jgi:hypothetical protein